MLARPRSICDGKERGGPVEIYRSPAQIQAANAVRVMDVCYRSSAPNAIKSDGQIEHCPYVTGKSD